jgi:hypothetical protein
MSRRLALVLVLASCKAGAPEQVLANDAKREGVEAKTRRSTAKDGKLAWGGLVTNASDRLVRGADVVIVVRKGGGTAIGEGRAHVDLLPPGYGVRLEVNGIALTGSPASVDVVLEKVDVAPPEEKAFEWKPAPVGWKKPLPEGVAFDVHEDEKCAGVLGKKGEGATFRCVVGVKHTGTRPAKLDLVFESPRGAAPIFVKAPHGTDLPILPGDALVYFVQSHMPVPTEMILKGTAEAR